MKQSSINYDLEERTAQLAEKVLLLCKTLPKDVISIPIISQLVRSVTSIGANYREANGASSPKDFQNKIFICKKEAKETQYWLRILLTNFPDKKEELEPLFKEATELVLIFQKITSTLKQKLNIENSIKILRIFDSCEFVYIEDSQKLKTLKF